MFLENLEGKQKRIALAVVAALVVLLVVALVVGTGAKYASTTSEEDSAGASNFYFTSDFLTKDGASYNLPVGTTEFTFELRNYVDNLRWSDDAIEYSYSVSKDGSEVGSGSGYLVAANKSSRSETITGLTTGTYEVTATANSPYAETLKATFTIAATDDDLSVQVQDSEGSPYASLIVATKDYSGNVVVKWSAGVFPDTTQSDFVDTKTYGSDSYSAGSQSVSMGKFSSKTYRFMKVDASKNYSGTEITAEKGN